METLGLFDTNDDKDKKFEKVKCDRCSKKCEAYYTLSSLTKGLWLKCRNCGTHAAPYQEGLKIPWKPSKTFIKEVGKDEAFMIAKKLEENQGSGITRPAHTMINKQNTLEETRPNPTVVIYCDAGTKNNGQKGKQKTVVVVCDSKKNILKEEWIGDYSNNEGEIVAITACLKDFSNNKPIEIKTDSRIAAGWATKGWTKYHEKQHRKGKLTDRHRRLIQEAHTAYKKTQSTITWISRDENFAGHYIEENYGM